MQLIYLLGMEHGELHTDDAMMFFFNELLMNEQVQVVKLLQPGS